MSRESLEVTKAIEQYNQQEIFNNIAAKFETEQKREDGIMYRHKIAYDLTAIVSFSKEEDEKIWKHISFARQKTFIEYKRLEELKDLFCGDSYAIVVLPPREKMVTIHKHCIHLWEAMDGYPLPEFSGFLKNGRRTL